MKHYVFLSMILGAGGVQCYVASKARFLESIGWHVVVISDNNPASHNKCLIEYLNKFIRNGNPFLGVCASKLPRVLVHNTIHHLLESIGPVTEGDEVIIESCDDVTAIWGELLAEQLKARHFFWAANEHFRGQDRCYEDQIDFFMFKMDRGEIFTSFLSANRLFEGYRTYEIGDFSEYSFTEDPIQDVDFPQIGSIKKKDYTICYLGRSRKPYFPSIISGVITFASNHQEKEIQLLLIGEVADDRRYLLTHECPNLVIVEFGDLFPLPRKLFSLVDVIIAGSGSARHSADEGALVITADPEKCVSHGLLGYDTNESLYKDEFDSDSCLDLSFADALERALVEQTWKEQSNKWKRSLSVEDCTYAQLQKIREAEKDRIYFDKERLLSGKTEWTLIYRVLLGMGKVYIKNVIHYLTRVGKTA